MLVEVVQRCSVPCPRAFCAWKIYITPLIKLFLLNRWRTPVAPIGANLVLVVSKGSKFPISVKFSGKVAKVCTQVFVQKWNFSLSPIKSTNFFPEALSKFSLLSVNSTAQFWSEKVSPIILKFGQTTNNNLNLWLPKFQFNLKSDTKITAQKQKCSKTWKCLLDKIKALYNASKNVPITFLSDFRLNWFFGNHKFSLLS